MGLDLSNTVDTVATEDKGRIIVILDECGDPYIDPDTKKPITAHIVGTYSKRFRKAQDKARAAEARHNGRLTDDEKDDNQRKTWSAAVITWDFVLGGEMAPPATIFALKPHIYDQIVAEAGKHAAFFAPSSTT